MPDHRVLQHLLEEHREAVCREEAVARAEQLHRDSADIIVGAESILPEARQLDLLPVMEALKARHLLVSVESYYPESWKPAAAPGPIFSA